MSDLKLLSTRLLSKQEQSQLEELGYQVDQLASIDVELIDFEMPEELSDLVFTSQNAIRSFVNHPRSKSLELVKLKAYCVGERTANLAKESGFKVPYWANNSEELAQMIKENDSDKSLVYFSGSISMRALIEGLKSDEIPYHEVVVYNTTETQPILTKEYDMILFFSPSGVRSICANNDISKAVKVCIGPTTAGEFKTENNLLIAEYPPSFNHMIQAIKQYKN
jgi:uroporphyrinogen-III synthase